MAAFGLGAVGMDDKTAEMIVDQATRIKGQVMLIGAQLSRHEDDA